MLSLSQQSFAATVAEFYYSLSPYTVLPLTGAEQTTGVGVQPVINNPPSQRGDWPLTTKAFFMANNLVPSDWSFKSLSPNSWSGAIWTGLEPQNRTSASQKALANGGLDPSYGSSLIQVDGQNIGMQLSTWGLPQRANITSSLQLAADIRPLSVLPWQQRADSQLCMNAVLDLHSWYGNQVQGLFTIKLSDMTSGTEPNLLGFFVNVMLLDTDVGNTRVEAVFPDSELDTKEFIAITFAQTNNENALQYSGPIPGYGATLGAYDKTASKSTSTATDSQHYGACFSYTQVTNLLTKVISEKGKQNTELLKANPNYPVRNFSSNPAHYRLDVAIVSPEIKGDGNMGMAVKAMNVYRIIP